MQIRNRLAKICQCFGGRGAISCAKARPLSGHAACHDRSVTNRKTKPTSVPRRRPRRPLQDEWGIYDPEQAGLQVIIQKLMTAPDNDVDDDDREDDRPLDH